MAINIGLVGATGYVGQMFACLLDGHPWFRVSKLAASNASAGKTYQAAVENRWKLSEPMPAYIRDMPLQSLDNLESFASGLDLVFCAVNMPKESIRQLEESIAALEVPVVSNNSACRHIPDVPVIIPELNPTHSAVIDLQKRRLGTKRGFITAKPNCSIQSYVPALTPLLHYKPTKVNVCTYQAITGAGLTLADAPHVINNLIPYIAGEERKSEQEPLKIWGTVTSDGIEQAAAPIISAQCYRVCVEAGHTAAVSVLFELKPHIDDILNAWANFAPDTVGLPSTPVPFLRYLQDEDRPQPLLDAGYNNGMGVSIGRLRHDNIFDYKFTCLSHNGIRGAAGGAILTAELLVKQGYI